MSNLRKQINKTNMRLQTLSEQNLNKKKN